MNERQLNEYEVTGYDELTGEIDYGNIDTAKEFFEKFISGDMSVITRQYLGLCANLNRYSEYTFRAYSFIPNHCEDWEHRSLDRNIPVKYSVDCTEYYEGEQLEYRLSLAKHLLGKLEGMVNDEKTTKD